MALQKEERGEHLGPEQAVPDEVGTVERQRHYVTPETLQRVLRVRERLMQESGGHVFEDSSELIHQMSEERTRELEQSILGDSADGRQPMTPEEIKALDQLREQIIQKRKRNQTQ